MEDNLFIKQSAILEVIRELGMINFQTIKRNFVGTNERTLRYHLKQLQNKRLIKKRGTTKGVYYEDNRIW